jgi:hypothetical protein
VSQYPYSPPPNAPYGYPPQDPVASLLAPAKRASICMFLMAGLMLPCGALMTLLSAMLGTIDLSKLPPENAAQLRELEQQLASSGISITGLLLSISVTILVVGIVMLVLGILVRKGGLGSAVSGIIVCCLLGLLAVFSVLGSAMASAQGKGEALMGTCMWGVLLVLLVYTLISLFQAARNSGQVAAYRNGYGMQGQAFPPMYPPGAPSQQPQTWQQPPPGQWGQPAWPPQQPPKPPQNWPPPPSNPT